MSRYTRKHVTVTVEDATGAYSMTLGPGPGDFSGTNDMEGNAEVIDKMDSGSYDGSVYGDDVAQELGITLELRPQSITHPSQARLVDLVKKQGYWAAATTTDTSSSPVWRTKCIVTINDGITSTTRTYPNVRWTAAKSVGQEAITYTLSGSNRGAPVDA